MIKIYSFVGLYNGLFTWSTVLDRLEDPSPNPKPPKCRKGSIRENDEFSEKMKSFSSFLVDTETSNFLKKFKNLFNIDIQSVPADEIYPKALILSGDHFFEHIIFKNSLNPPIIKDFH